MKNKMIKVGNVVPSLKVADVSYNKNVIIDTIKDNQDCGVLLFPELSVCGYTCADLFGNHLLLDKCEEALVEIAKQSKCLVVVGAPLRKDNSLYNCAVFMSNGEINGVIPKSIFLLILNFMNLGGLQVVRILNVL